METSESDGTPKKAKLRDVAGIWLLGTAITLMTPEWRKYTRMLVAASVIRDTAEEAVAKRRATMGDFGQVRFPTVPATDSEARTDDHIPGRGGW